MEEKRGEAHQRGAHRGAARHRRRAIAVACPFCMTMITDGVKAQGSEVPVIDIAEAVAERLA